MCWHSFWEVLNFNVAKALLTTIANDIMSTRRSFLRHSSLALLSMNARALPRFVLNSARSLEAQSSVSDAKGVLVCVFQRGAMDGLMAVQPFNDPDFRTSRMRLRMSVNEHGLIPLDDRFALHPALAAWKPLYDTRQLAIVHGIGSPNNNRSHFAAQDSMESGLPGRTLSDGWLNRSLQSLPDPTSALRAVSTTAALPLSLDGKAQALAIDDLRTFRLKTEGNAQSAQGFEDLYLNGMDALLGHTAQEGFDASEQIQSILRNSNTKNTAAYAQSPLAQHFRQLAQLIKADLGLRVAFVESDGWDTHVQQGTINGQFQRTASDFAGALSAFWEDLDQWKDRVTVLCMTEFGRTVRENGSGGTDHGRGSCMFVLSSGLREMRVHGTVGPLSAEHLADGRDLPVTTDYRALASAVLHHRLGLRDFTNIFPGWTGSALPLFSS